MFKAGFLYTDTQGLSDTGRLYGHAVAAAVAGCDDVEVRELEVMFNSDQENNEDLLRQALGKMAGVDVIYLQFSQYIWGHIHLKKLIPVFLSLQTPFEMTVADTGKMDYFRQLFSGSQKWTVICRLIRFCFMAYKSRAVILKSKNDIRKLPLSFLWRRKVCVAPDRMLDKDESLTFEEAMTALGQGKALNAQAYEDPGASSNICVVTRNPVSYSETFIVDHARNLNARIFVLVPVSHQNRLLGSILRTMSLIWISLFKKNPADTVHLDHFRKYLIKNKIKTVLAEYGTTGALVAGLCQKLNIPLIVHFHGFDAFREDIVNNKKNGYMQLFMIARRIVAVSPQMKLALIEMGAPESKIVYRPCSVDTFLFKSVSADKNPPVFLSVGRFIEKKSPDSTILAFSRVHKKYPEARLIMVGQGPLVGMCKEIVRDFGLEQAVFFKNACPHKQVLRLLAGARCYVQHSKVALNGDREGTPVAVLEAAASGLPVVATRHCGIMDAVIDGVTGLLVDEEDINAMADAMIKFIEQPLLAHEMGLAARAHIEANFSRKIWNAQFSEILARAMEPQDADFPPVLPGIKKTFVLTVCGDEDVPEVNWCLKFLKKQISPKSREADEYGIVVLAGRTAQTIDHDRIITVDIPAHMSDAQGSRFLKTGPHRHLGQLEGQYCYLDNDAYVLSRDALSIFEFKKGPVSFATDHRSTVKSFSVPSLYYGNLKDAIQEHFGIFVDPDWKIWNSGVYLFDEHSTSFLDTWHEYTLRTFGIPQWKVKDQGPLIAAVWKHGLQDIPRIPSMYNWIFRLSEEAGSKTVFNGRGIEYQGQAVKIIHMVGKDKGKIERLWVEACSLIMDQRSPDFKRVLKIHRRIRKASILKVLSGKDGFSATKTGSP